MKLEITYTLHMNEKEVKALSNLLGGMSEPEFDAVGVNREDREILREIWNHLPAEFD